MASSASPLERGERAYQDGRHDEALVALRLAVAEGKSLDRAHYFLGAALFAKGELGKALESFVKAKGLAKGKPILKEDPAALLVFLARTAYRLHDYAANQEYAEEGVRLFPDDARAHNLLGHSFYARNDHEPAVAAYRKAIAAEAAKARYPESPGVLQRNLANALRGLKRPQEALAALEDAIRLEPSEPDQYNVKGLILADDLKQLEPAVEAVRRAIDLDPACASTNTNGVYYYNIASYLQRLGRRDQALVFIDKAVSFKADNASYLKLQSELRQAGGGAPDPETPRYTFADVGGMKQLKAELGRAMDVLLVHREEAKRYKIEKNGILLFGPPGCGKTFFAEALAGEFKLKFLRVSVGSVVSRFIGDSAQNVEKVFREAVLKAPCLLFFDEFEALAAQRGEEAQHVEDQRTVDALLQQIDRHRSVPGLIIAAATNDIETLDKAIVREGRFDYKVKIYKPDFEARLEILGVRLKGRPVAPSIDTAYLADRTEGFSTAKLAGLVDTAALCAMEAGVPIADEHLRRALTDELGRERYTGRHRSWSDLILDPETEKKLRFLEQCIENPDAAKEMGVAAPTGLLLCGPPGTGKTTIARVLACEVAASFYLVTPADIYSKWLGESEKRVKELFERARDNRPAIIFIDEIDALLTRRDDGGASPWRNTVVNLFLMEMDGVATVPGVFVVGATNRPDILDEALLRPGRLSETIRLPLPAAPQRRRLLELFLQKVKLAPDVDLGRLAERAEGCSGADIEDLCAHAGRSAFLRVLGADSGRRVEAADFEAALKERSQERASQKESRAPIGFQTP